MTGAVLLHMDNVTKRFGAVQALRGVSLNARAGEVLALMGENGAGKSTLLRLMSGVHQPDSGSIAVDGKSIVFATPHAARGVGVRVVVQEPEIIPDVSVAENVYAGALPRRGRIFDRGALRLQLEQDLSRYGFTGVLRADQLGRTLSPAQRQVVEILRALTGGARVIAFDEPTSSLSDHEVESLFRLIAQLKTEGIAIIYVSHRMKEIFRIADRILVLRDGATVGERAAIETSEPELVRMMVGRDLSALFPRSQRNIGRTVLRVHEVTTTDVRDISFEVRAGEVVALAGLVGAGRTELAHAIIGDTPILFGVVEVEGKRLILRSPRDAVLAGLALAPEERKQQALLMKRSVRDNICLAVLGRLQKWRFVSRREESRIAQRYVQELRVRTPTINQDVSTLSGGNQQKTVLARWLARDAKLLILDEPTRGVDVGAKADIYAIIDKLAAQGSAILVISSELPEVLGLADRIIVMQGGRVRGELDRSEATEERILSLAILEDAAWTISAQEPVKTAAVPHTSLPRRVLAAVGVQNISLLLALVLLVAFIGAQNTNFFYTSNIATIGTTIAIVGVLAVVQTVVMLLGGLDISVGSQAGLTSVVSAMVFMATGSALAGIAAALALGLCLGLLNGVIIIYGRVNAVIATLATFAAFRGMANLISDGRAQGYTGMNHLFVFLARGDIIGIPVLIWILILVAALIQVMLHFTDIGRNIYAVGGNATAARLAGIPLNRYIVGCYMLVGLVAGLAGILLTARTGSGQPTSGSQGLELQSITAAALGGVALQGGRGTIVGTILAVILLGVLENGLIILNVNSFWQDIAQGALLVIAVVIQQRRANSRGVGLP